MKVAALILSLAILSSIPTGMVAFSDGPFVLNNGPCEEANPMLQDDGDITTLSVNVNPKYEALLQDKKEKKKVYKGQATYYSDKYHGKPTASGELYDTGKYTAAIRTNALPFEWGTMVEVTNVKTKKKVRVKVNDKMSDKATAIIDLSRAAAEEIGLITAGRMDVEIRVVKK